jgi:HAD superfamily hydrolase (TIGR01509 family)
MDGTIVDTNHIWRKATDDLVAARGISLHSALHQEIAALTHGLTLTESCKIIKNMLNLPDPLEEIIKEKSQRSSSLYEQEIKFIGGFEEFHQKVLLNRLRNGIATNADDTTLRISKQKFNLEHFFGVHIYNISQVNNLFKPHPAVYLHAAEKLEVDPKECIAIEDSAHGVQAAKNAGMLCIGINSSKKIEQLCNADIIVDDYYEINLPALLKPN